MAYIYAYNIGTTSFTCNISDLDTAYTGTLRTCRWYLNNTLRGTVTIPNGQSSGGAYSFTGLSSSTTYTVRADITYSGGSVSLTAYVTTSASASTRPSNWNWSSTISSGSQIRLSAAEWNSFCTRINAFRNYKGLSNYSFTYVYSGGQIQAAHVNQARTAIDAISGRGTLPGTVSVGASIQAYHYTQLRTALNAVS